MIKLTPDQQRFDNPLTAMGHTNWKSDLAFIIALPVIIFLHFTRRDDALRRVNEWTLSFTNDKPR